MVKAVTIRTRASSVRVLGGGGGVPLRGTKKLVDFRLGSQSWQIPIEEFPGHGSHRSAAADRLKLESIPDTICQVEPSLARLLRRSHRLASSSPWDNGPSFPLPIMCQMYTKSEFKVAHYPHYLRLKHNLHYRTRLIRANSASSSEVTGWLERPLRATRCVRSISEASPSRRPRD